MKQIQELNITWFDMENEYTFDIDPDLTAKAKCILQLENGKTVQITLKELKFALDYFGVI